MSRHAFNLLVAFAGAVFAQGPAAVDSGGEASAAIGSDFDFSYADLAKDRAFVEYGTMKLLPGGHVDAQVWSGNARDPVPAMADTGRLSPIIDPAGRSVSSDKGRKVLSNPAAFSGPVRRVWGDWWQARGGLCVRVDNRPVVYLRQIALANRRDWGAIFRSEDMPGACNAPAGATPAVPADKSTVALLSERVYGREKPDFRVKYQHFDGIISRLNGWDPGCALSTWDKTSLNFRPGTFEAVGKNVWRAITMEHQPKAGDMAVFSYLAIPPDMTPAGRIVLMDVSHDFNRNGRIDDDWGHLYAGVPVISRAGDLGGLMMVDMSPVGIREIPFKGGCPGAAGAQLTRTLGLILYLSDELGADLGR